ncbi:MAG TPA: hypothetical protein VMB77_14220 [Syntrophales bacterium]|nr:hypothetical protein [Syntrophales bacterium]
MADTKKKKDAAGTAKKTGTKARKKEPAITMQDALRIAQAFLADKGAFGVNGVRDGMDENLAPYSAADIRLQGMLKDCWIVECGLDPFQVVDGSTMLVGISKTTGDIIYAGILSIA